MTVIRTGIPQYMANLEAQRDVAIARAEAAEKRVAELEEVIRAERRFLERWTPGIEPRADAVADTIQDLTDALNKSK